MSNIAMLVDISRTDETGRNTAEGFIIIVHYNDDYYLCKEWSLKYQYFLLYNADPFEEGNAVIYFDQVTSYKIIESF
jgi:hypothetical protein